MHLLFYFVTWSQTLHLALEAEETLRELRRIFRPKRKRDMKMERMA
jgi:hypothetical protein